MDALDREIEHLREMLSFLMADLAAKKEDGNPVAIAATRYGIEATREKLDLALKSRGGNLLQFRPAA